VHVARTVCGAALGGCTFERPEHHDRLVRLVMLLVRDEA